MRVISIILCGAFLCKHGVTGSIGDVDKDFPTKRKANLFLQNNAISGLGDIVSPEDIVPQAKDYLPISDEDALIVDPIANEAVLAGNYPESKLQIDEPSGNSAHDDGLFVGQQFLNKLLLMDPVEELLLKPNATSNETDSEGGTTLSPTEEEAAEIEPKSLKEGLGHFLKKLLECKAKLIFCKRKNIISCYLHCLLNKHPIGKIVKSNINSLIKLLCDPLGTAFDEGVRLFNKQYENIKSLKHFLALLGIVPDAFKRFTRLAANAIPAMLLKYGNVEGADLFKPVLSSLESDAKAVGGKRAIVDTATELSNPGCPIIDNFNAVQLIVSILYKNPKIVDVFLSGMWMISKIFHMIAVPHLKSTLKAVGGALSILVGVNCGLVHYIQTGNNSTCEGDYHVEWEAAEGEIVRPEVGRPEVCGAAPHIPYQSLILDLIPPIFDQEETTTLATSQTGGDNSTDSEEAANKTKDTHWIDDVAKTLDTDDDR